MKINRSSGILLPVHALPSPYGIGSFGKAAYDFIDFLKKAGISYWQILPLGPTGYGDSPYQSFSAFAGNPYFIDLDTLKKEGLLKQSEIDLCDFGTNPRYVDYEKIYLARFGLLRKAVERAKQNPELAAEKNDFASCHGWLSDYALYMAVKEHFGQKAWTEWEEEGIRLHRPESVEKYRQELDGTCEFYEYLQYFFFKQWNTVKDYAHEKGIRIIGDIPLYVSMDSADIWAESQYFQLDERGVPAEVAGVPPDYFSEDGQLWGNPLYNYDRMRQDGWSWWIRRVGGASELYDVIRIDHFRGFSTYWAVPYGAETAKGGHWVKGPGMDLVGTLTSWFSNVTFIAEDLGQLTPDVYELLKASGLPGMKVLEFAFDGLEENEYQPHLYSENCICYTGTHDNAPIAEWMGEVSKKVLNYTEEYLGNPAEPLPKALIRAGYRSTARLFVSQIQDWLGFGAECRTNTPATMGMNWQWRLLPGECNAKIAKEIYRFNMMYSRLTYQEKI